MDKALFDDQGRFVLDDFARMRPFSSFLPGIAGPLGIPMWAFYVNRGQAIASFGIENKDNPIMEFEPANKAYQTTPYTGFRTFLKLKSGADSTLYEPFAPWNNADRTRMHIGMNELALQATSAAHGLQTEVLYFTLTGEPFAGLVRQVRVTNVGDAPLALEIMDGMPRVMPYGVDNRGLKHTGRTLEAWMGVLNVEEGVPFYRLQASAGDTAQVSEIQAGHFYLVFDGAGQRLLPFVDPVVVFGQNTALSQPDGFVARSLRDLSRRTQITTGRTPCGFFGAEALLEPSEKTTLYAIIGRAGKLDSVRRQTARLAQPSYVARQRQEAEQLVNQLTDVVATGTSSARFDAYVRQTFLDNVLRGGWPLILGNKEAPTVYHIYSRKHGDLERDYNDFNVAPEPYSQGNANYRDVNQNRRCDVLLQPEVGAFNVLSFLGLIQADGYNPLVVEGTRFTLSPDHRADVLDLVERPDELEPLLTQRFTPGQLLRTIADQELRLKVSPEALVAQVLTHAEQHVQATFGQGYWIDHWTYNLDLIESYLAIYPDRREELLFGKQVAYFDSSAVVQPRAEKYVLITRGVRQYGAVVQDEEKAALIAARSESPNLVRTAHGQGEVYRTSVFAKLLGLALIKFATLDPLGMGMEMEAGKPGWYDALNGLPGLFGSSLCETYELERLLTFLIEAAEQTEVATVELPLEQFDLLQDVTGALRRWRSSPAADRDVEYWDTAATARETYRDRVRLGFGGEMESLSAADLTETLTALRAKVQGGIERAVDGNDGVPPTYFAYEVTDYEMIADPDGHTKRDQQGRPYVRARRFDPHVLPLFLEGPVHALKIEEDLADARALYGRVKGSPLYDRKLAMYKVNAPLEGESHEIGRCRAFTPGWLENESIWLHMEYKYLLELLKAELYEAFYQDLKRALICFQDPAVYGRSPLENSSFLVSSAHPDKSLHGAGFVARLTGATAEFLSMWRVMMFGQQPFFLRDGALCLAFRPALPGWLFDEAGTLRSTFLGHTDVVYHNSDRVDVFPDRASTARMVLRSRDGTTVDLPLAVVEAPYARQVRLGRVERIDVFLEQNEA